MFEPPKKHRLVCSEFPSTALPPAGQGSQITLFRIANAIASDLVFVVVLFMMLVM